MGALETHRSPGYARQPEVIRGSLSKALGYDAFINLDILGGPGWSGQANSIVDIPTMHQSRWHVSIVEDGTYLWSDD